MGLLRSAARFPGFYQVYPVFSEARNELGLLVRDSLKNKTSSVKCPCHPYNVGSDQEITIADLAQIVLSTLGRSVMDTAFTPNFNSSPSRYVPSADRARFELDLRVPIPLNESIQRTASWHASVYSLAGPIPQSLLRSSKRSNPPAYLNASGLAPRIFTNDNKNTFPSLSDMRVPFWQGDPYAEFSIK
jgi:hypothetical protein